MSRYTEDILKGKESSQEGSSIIYGEQMDSASVPAETEAWLCKSVKCFVVTDKSSPQPWYCSYYMYGARGIYCTQIYDPFKINSYCSRVYVDFMKYCVFIQLSTSLVAHYPGFPQQGVSAALIVQIFCLFLFRLYWYLHPFSEADPSPHIYDLFMLSCLGPQ